MQAFAVLIGQIFIIISVQTIIGMFIGDDKPLMTKILDIACYLGCLYIVLQFMYSTVFKEMMNAFKNIF